MSNRGSASFVIGSLVLIAACSSSGNTSSTGSGGSGPGGVTSTTGASMTTGSTGTTSSQTGTTTGAATASSTASTGSGCPGNTSGCTWTPTQQDEAWKLTSIWENDTTVLQYAYCENIQDGRGYTSGRAGFCTGCGDAVQVVQCYDQANTGSSNLMKKYANAMANLSGGNTGPVDAIGNYCADWGTSASNAATSAAFNTCQDQLTMTLYQVPGCMDAHGWGIQTPLFLAELYDAEINHGEPDVSNMLTKAGQNANIPKSTTPLSQADESKLLHAFLTVRVGILAADPTWAQAVDRVAVYEKERLAGNFDLSQPVTTDAHASTYWPSMNLMSSGYSVCTLTPNACAIQVTGDPNCTM